jgi:hypothetical protein
MFARPAAEGTLDPRRLIQVGIGRASQEVIVGKVFQGRYSAEYEAVYGNMTRTGLAAAADPVPVTAKGRSAARRIGATVEDVPAVPYPGDEVGTPA